MCFFLNQKNIREVQSFLGNYNVFFNTSVELDNSFLSAKQKKINSANDSFLHYLRATYVVQFLLVVRSSTE